MYCNIILLGLLCCRKWKEEDQKHFETVVTQNPMPPNYAGHGTFCSSAYKTATPSDFTHSSEGASLQFDSSARW